MADANQAADELARVMAQVSEDLARFGKVTQQTQSDLKDAQMKAKYGIENYTKATEKGADAVMALASAGMAAGKAMYDGKKGAAAFNASLDEMSKAATAAGVALALLIPGGVLIKGLIAGITAATTAFIKYEQAANEMADKLHKGYQGLAKAGGAAADGMTGVFKDAKKLGLSMNELDQMVSLVAENSKDFALFAGSVSQGRKQFANLSEAMAPARQGLMNMGLSMQDINQGTAEYLRLQTRTGRAQQMTTAQLAKGAEQYLKEMDGLTKLTGQSRQEMQQQRDRMLQQEQSAAKLRALEMAGNKDGADALKQLGNMLGAAGPKMQTAFNAAITGNLASKEAQEANLASQGELARVVELVQNKQITAAEGAQRVAKAMGQTADTVGTQLGQLNAYESSGYGNFAEQQNLRLLAENNFTKSLNQINKDQTAQIAGADKITDQQNQLILKQMQANQELEKFVFSHVPKAQEHMIALATAAEAAAKALNIIANAGDGSKVNRTPTQGTQLSSVGANYQASDDERKAMMEALNDPKVSERDKEWMRQQLKNMPARAAGGPVSAGKSYLVGEKGPEMFIPEMSGQIVPNGIMGTENEQTDRADKMDKFAKTMLKDTESLTKITDTDLKRTKNYSILQNKLFEKKTKLMEDELELLDEQNEVLEKMLEIAEKAGGKDAAAALKKQFTLARMNMGGGIPGMGGGMSMPSAGGMNMPGMGGGQGLKGPEEHQAVGQGGGQGLKGPPKLATIRSKSGKSTSVNAEYAPRFQSLIDYLDSVGYEINSLGGYVDRDVRGKPGVKSVHAHGGAIDINPGANPMGGQLITDMPENISAIAKQLGLGWGGNWASIKDAMHFSVASNEGGDIKLSEGGVAVGPDSGYPATLHGKEAVIPLNNAGGNFVKMFESMAESNAKMAAMMEEMVRAQKNSVDVQTKMLRAQA